MDYVVKLEGQTVRCFQNKTREEVERWQSRYCKHGVIVELVSQNALPKASGRIYPNEDMSNLVYRPFVPTMA